MTPDEEKKFIITRQIELGVRDPVTGRFNLPQIFNPDGEFVDFPELDLLPPEARKALERVRKRWERVKAQERIRDDAQARIAAEVEEIRTVQPFAREWTRIDEVRAMIHAGGR